ncbi:hypothetical protein GJ496_005124 [Pomphorhynchus laevis]|nr:hypothetical protein GJ496_005124 [Pomphorhynchus laevis]
MSFIPPPRNKQIVDLVVSVFNKPPLKVTIPEFRNVLQKYGILITYAEQKSGFDQTLLAKLEDMARWLQMMQPYIKNKIKIARKNRRQRRGYQSSDNQDEITILEEREQLANSETKKKSDDLLMATNRRIYSLTCIVKELNEMCKLAELLDNLRRLRSLQKSFSVNDDIERILKQCNNLKTDILLQIQCLREVKRRQQTAINPLEYINDDNQLARRNWDNFLCADDVNTDHSPYIKNFRSNCVIPQAPTSNDWAKYMLIE